MTFISRFTVLSAASSVLLLTACSQATTERAMEDAMEHQMGGNAEVDMQGDNMMMHMENSEGSFAVGNSMPDSWPDDVPTYQGAEVSFVGSSNPVTGSAGVAVTLITGDSMDQVVSFYRSELEGLGWALDATMQAPGVAAFTATKDTRTLSVFLSGTDDGHTSVTLGVEMPGA